MARARRSATLETRTQRDKLKISRNPYYVVIGHRLSLGYRKGHNVRAWVLRADTGDHWPHGGIKYRVENLEGRPDDFEDADGNRILSYFQACQVAMAMAKEMADKKAGLTATVGEAFQHYLAYLFTKVRDYPKAEAQCLAIVGELGHLRLSTLTAADIEAWRNGQMAKAGTDPEAIRRRKATVNRLLTTLKAALNRAYESGMVKSKAWEGVKSFKGADVAKERFLTQEECMRLISATSVVLDAPPHGLEDFHHLLWAALLTGARYTELHKTEVRDFNPTAASLHLRITKNGKARHVPLTAEGVQLFRQWTARKASHELIFTREDGQPWGPSHQQRRMEEACKRARIKPAVSFHSLRSTYGALLAMQGVSLQVIAKVLGHSDTRITEKHYAHLLPGYLHAEIQRGLPSFTAEPQSGAEHNVVNLKR